jgi:hypothetical protein
MDIVPVVTPKTAKPFIRTCGNYVTVKKHIIMPHNVIPNVKYSIEECAGFKEFIDIDVSKVKRTSDLLMLSAVWGLLKPKFIPGGVSRARGVLMTMMRDIFVHFEMIEVMEFMIVIFDNMLILANDFDSAFNKLKKVIKVCRERNVC